MINRKDRKKDHALFYDYIPIYPGQTEENYEKSR
jgi:hypothetical protein